MAIYHASVKIISRSAGRSAVAAAAYRSASEMIDDKTGVVHDYTRKGSVTHSEIMAPEGAPEWATDRARLWNAVEAAEKRKDSQLARELELALPRELSHGQRVELVRSFVREKCVAHGMVADVAIHEPKALDGDEQPHAHIMLTMRRIEGGKFGKKATEWNPEFGRGKDGQAYVADTSPLVNLREAWAGHVNAALERAGRTERVDHRSLAAQQAEAVERGDDIAALTLDRRPEPKIGPVALQMVRAGRAEEAHAFRDVQSVRQDRARLHQIAGQVIDMAKAARDLVQHQADRLTALGSRLEAAMQATARKAKEAAIPAPDTRAQQVQALSDSEVQSKWKALFEEKFRQVKSRAEKLADVCRSHGEFWRDKQAKHLNKMPSPIPPTGLFAAFKMKSWKNAKEEWSKANSKLCSSISHHEKRGVALSKYTERSTIYSFGPSKAEALAAKILEKEHPDLSKRKQELDSRQKEREVAERREKLLQQQKERQSRSRGRGFSR